MSNEYQQEFRNPISNEFAAEAFGNKKSGFKPISAIFEIIDNSIEAKCNEIQIKIDWTEHTGTRTFRKAKNIIFIDDGEGMSSEKVYDYFIAAITDKKDNKEGIGKFGVGAYLSCISQTTQGEVYSKTKGGIWYYTILKRGEKLPKPIPKDPPKEYQVFEHGTVVIWSDIIQKFSDNDIVGDTGLKLLHEIGRTYRKFLTDKKVVPTKKGTEIIDNKNKIKIQIFSGSEKTFEVIPYDPLFITHNQKTDDTEIPKIVSQRVKVTVDDDSGWMVITYSFFPETWWGGKGEVIYRPGNDPRNLHQRKISEEDQGISLVREGREIYFGQYPGGPIKIVGASDSTGNRNFFDYPDRFTGIEIEFTRDSDEVFAVEFNKSKISMDSEVRQKISKAISPTVISRRNYFSSERNKNDESKGHNHTKKGKKGTKIIHDKTHKPKINSEQEKKLRIFAERFKDSLENTEEVYQDLLNGYHVSLGYGLDSEGPFVSYSYEGEVVLVKYNMEHPFMKIFFTLLEDIGQKLGAEEGKGGEIQEVQKTRAIFDILLAAFGFSKNTFPNMDQPQDVASTIRQLTNNWGVSAHRLSNIDLDQE
jgi:hypothetical protein